MHTTIVKYQLPNPVPREEMLAIFRASEENFRKVPGLIRKYYSYDEAAHCGHSVYIWESEEAACAFTGPEFAERMKEAFGTAPEAFTVETLFVVDGPAG